MLLEQQNRRRLLMARQEQDTMGQSSAHPYHRLATASSGYPSGNHALQDFQMQMMLLDQQNKKRHIMARQQPNSMGLPPSLPLPNLSGSIISPHETRRSELHASAPRERNEQCLLDNLQGPVAGGQHLGSGPNQPVTNG